MTRVKDANCHIDYCGSRTIVACQLSRKTILWQSSIVEEEARTMWIRAMWIRGWEGGEVTSI
jgi:hypothetical protein